MSNKFYITTPIYYINAKPHIGSAYTTIAADVLARFHRMIGDDTFFLTGTDEHGEKNEAIAKKENIDPQEYSDKMSAEFELTWDSLNISNDNFIRTTNKKHKQAVQKALQYMYDKGYIYKGEHSGLYCPGCEQYKTEKDLDKGLCPDHKTKPKVVSEESYMFKMSAFSNKIKKAIEKDELLITPKSKKKEILSFYKDGLKDISFSRTNTTWGVELPWDKKQVSYVWPDAFLNYLTGLDWSGTAGKAPKMWPANVHLMSKDILRVHATIWPAMLLALDLPLPKELFIHGFFLVDGHKMSKSIGNVISPDELIKKYGVDGSRYLLMSATPFGHDGDISFQKFDEKYNADLANGLGNLVARSLTLTLKLFDAGLKLKKTDDSQEIDKAWKSYSNKLENIEIDKALKMVNEQIQYLDGLITKTKPWELIKTKSAKVEKIMYNILETIYHISLMLLPFMPETSDKILESLGIDPTKEKKKNFKDLTKWGRLSEKAKVKKIDILFPRI
ncbi:methionine--tRNA ligase [Candidatus Falkowbacteria bacterium]|jgi:methionyl-tRNA synthetase|nr:methionine--tRNA ligase [Candidatus Falkowbacteria bacterium]MBT4433093.1 methionine--tRNA ligase [Candidatus Falkowbacteria bacterium]